MIPEKVYLMIFNLLPMIILFTIVTVLVRVILALYAKEKISIYKEIKTLVTTIYLFALFWLVTTTDFESFSNNFVPFKEIMRYSITSKLFYRNVIGNILLFLPFGYITTDLTKEKTNKTNIFITLLIVSLTSLSIEVIQMYIGRSFDIDDIMLNALGGLIGFISYKLIHLVTKEIKNDIIKTILFLLFILAILIGVLLMYGVI